MLRKQLIPLHLIAILTQLKVSEQKTFFFGLLFPWQGFSPVGSHSAGAVTVAIDVIHNDTDTFPLFHKAGHRMNFTWSDTECDASIGLPHITSMFYERGVDSFIGPGCSVIVEPGGYLVSDWEVPMISWGSTSSAMSNKDIYPTFARTTAPNARSAPFFAEILFNFDYRTVAIFYSSDNVWSSLALALKEILEESEINIAVFFMFQPGELGNETEKVELKLAKTMSRGEC